MPFDVIYTINSRDNVILEMSKDYLKLDFKNIQNIIHNEFSTFLEILSSKQLTYRSFRDAIIPSKEKSELLLVFNTIDFKSTYGIEIYNLILPLLRPTSVNSFLSGDYVDLVKNQPILKSMLMGNLKVDELDNYKHSSQIYFIYINNLTNADMGAIQNGLANYSGFLGSVNITNQSIFKNYLSRILTGDFVKLENDIITSHEDDVSNNVNQNTYGYNFEENGYKVYSMQSKYYELFLSYKIESNYINLDQSDFEFALAALTHNVSPIDELNIKVAQPKLQYLKDYKTGMLEVLGMTDIEEAELEAKIYEKIKKSYIYNLRYGEVDQACLFNVMIEFPNVLAGDNITYKAMVGLKYNFDDNQLFVVTMY